MRFGPSSLAGLSHSHAQRRRPTIALQTAAQFRVDDHWLRPVSSTNHTSFTLKPIITQRENGGYHTQRQWLLSRRAAARQHSRPWCARAESREQVRSRIRGNCPFRGCRRRSKRSASSLQADLTAALRDAGCHSDASTRLHALPSAHGVVRAGDAASRAWKPCRGHAPPLRAWQGRQESHPIINSI